MSVMSHTLHNIQHRLAVVKNGTAGYKIFNLLAFGQARICSQNNNKNNNKTKKRKQKQLQTTTITTNQPTNQPTSQLTNKTKLRFPRA